MSLWPAKRDETPLPVAEPDRTAKPSTICAEPATSDQCAADYANRTRDYNPGQFGA